MKELLPAQLLKDVVMGQFLKEMDGPTSFHARNGLTLLLEGGGFNGPRSVLGKAGPGWVLERVGPLK